MGDRQRCGKHSNWMRAWHGFPLCRVCALTAPGSPLTEAQAAALAEWRGREDEANACAPDRRLPDASAWSSDCWGPGYTTLTQSGPPAHRGDPFSRWLAAGRPERRVFLPDAWPLYIPEGERWR